MMERVTLYFQVETRSRKVRIANLSYPEGRKGETPPERLNNSIERENKMHKDTLGLEIPKMGLQKQ